ncbi:MAG: endonuclease/exonuclease/phosphatase family protein, partial [Actinobacteria bacterium]|nr:endonuclease/exonuclease/phosphatase family protein [Actinomycetota bacterium]
ILVVGCTSDNADDGGTATASSEPTALAKGEPMDLKVLAYNIEYSGDETTDRVIKKLGADVVGVLESYNRLPEIAKNTGYPYYNVGLQILSKYPIHEPSGADGLYSFIEVQPGYVVALFNAHLDYVRYGPRLLFEGMPLDEVIASENEVRTSSIQIMTPDMQKLAGEGFPVFLTGDFNEPSSLDYTEETIGTRPGIDVAAPWPVSEALFDVGMLDTYREIHPDPLETPGLTKDNPDFRKGGAGDRIDYVYAGGPVTIKNSQLIGEPGGADVDRAFSPWTSDHRAVLSSFQATPVALPTTVSLDRRMLTEGEKLGVYYNAPGNDQTSIVIVPEGGDVSAAIDTADTGESGKTKFDTSSLEPGGYEIIMLDADGNELARNAFWIRSLEADVVMQTDKPTYQVGEPIVVTWDDGPANRWDWIGVYRKSAPDPTQDDYLLWGYTGGHESGALPPQVFGEMTLGEKSQGSPWPLPAGKYRIHYLLTDKYKSAGYVDVTVKG